VTVHAEALVLRRHARQAVRRFEVELLHQLDTHGGPFL
jgi:hypothetical protein